VEAQDGMTQLFISHVQDPDPQNPYTYQWSTSNFSDVSEIVIYPNDPQFCELCMYYIAVKANSEGSDYIITVSTANTVIEFQRGQPYVVMWPPQDTSYVYGRYDVIDPAYQLNLVVTPSYPTGYAETPNLYVSMNALPNATYFQWKSVPNRPYIIISPPTMGIYYIAAQGRGLYSASYASVLGYDDQSGVIDPIYLLNNVPQNWGENFANHWRYFSFTTDSTHPSLWFYLQQMGCGTNDACSSHGTCIDGTCSCNPPWFGAYCDNETSIIPPQLYVGFNYPPNFSNYVVKNTATPPHVVTATITNPAAGQYFIGIYSTNPNWFSIMAVFTYYNEDAPSLMKAEHMKSSNPIERSDGRIHIPTSDLRVHLHERPVKAKDKKSV